MADTRTKLISEDDVKDITPISANVDSKKFAHNILVAQDIHIKPLIGSECYNDLLTQKAASTLTAANTTLLNTYIKYALAWWTLYLSYPDLYATITPTGVSARAGEEYTPVSSSTLQILINNAKVKAEYYSDQAICYVKDNISSYPCYNENDCCTTIVGNGYGTSGIILDEPINDTDIILTKDDLRI